MEKKDKRQRLIVNFKNNELETKLYNYVCSLELEGHSTYIKKLIFKDMKEKGLI